MRLARTAAPLPRSGWQTAIWPAGVEPAVSCARSRRGGRLPYSQLTSTSGGIRTRSFRVEGPASSPVRPRGHGELRRQGSNLRLASNSRASYRSTTPEEGGRGVEWEVGGRGGGRKGRESNPQGPKAQPFSRRSTAPMAALPDRVAPAGFEPATTPIKSRRLFRLSYRARNTQGVTGRNRTCAAPPPPVCTTSFPDVPEGSTFYPYVECLRWARARSRRR